MWNPSAGTRPQSVNFNVQVGSFRDGAPFFEGDIAFARVWNRVLTSAEVAAHAEVATQTGCSAPSTNGLQAFWRFEAFPGATPTEWPDAVGSNPATLQNGVPALQA